MGVTVAGQVCVLPAMVVNGRRAGRTVVCTGGIHGDEFEARLGLAAVFDELDPDELHGRVLMLPVCNPWAAAAGTRCTPPAIDGLNLAREFPGTMGGLPTQVLAAELSGLIVRHLGAQDLLVDLHSGGTYYEYCDMVGFRAHRGPALAASEEAARHTGMARLWAIDPVPGTLTQWAAEVGIPAVGTEFRGQGQARHEDVAACRTAILGLLAHKGCVRRTVVGRDESEPRRTTTVFSPVAGFATELPPLGTIVDRGETLCTVLDTHDQEIATVVTPVAGRVWARRTFPKINDRDIVALIGET